MKAEPKASLPIKFYLSIGAMIILSAQILSCSQQPKSMFEQQAEANSASDIEIVNNIELGQEVAIVAPKSAPGDGAQTTHITIKSEQAIAQQPNCDPVQKQCQYFELNVLGFTPKQPWLTSIMWRTIAQVLAPQMPLASQDQTAKDTVAMLFNKVEYGELVDSTLPMYQRIDTELVLNPVISDTDSELEAVASGYLLVRSNLQQGADRQHLNYVMLDMQKKLQLTLQDILLPQSDPDALLAIFKDAKQQWLHSQNIEDPDIKDQPLTLSKQWYLDAKGLHMVYQAGELLPNQTDVVDLIAPYSLLQGVVKAHYMVQSGVDITIP